ncbi:MAG: DUF1847 domain-containing protein [Desulfobacterales bacterium]|nr:DUF1847 domain-containing protein [Desulfobacterales bacterium]
MKEKAKTACLCKKMGCWRGDDKGIPSYCQANHYLKEIERADKAYAAPEVVDIYSAACVVGKKNDGYRPRIEEALDFVKEMKFSKVGFAACVAFGAELALIRRLFEKDGIEVFSAGCQIGRSSATDRGLPHLEAYPDNSTCHPIAQAEILNKVKTQINFIIGLCMGHDILFTRYSKAPVSTLIVKDRLLGNNPAAAIYGWHARRSLFKIRRSDDEIV